MQIIVPDFETYYDRDYTLKKMSTEAYVRDPRFEIHGCAIKRVEDGQPIRTDWWEAGQLKWLFDNIDWAATGCLCQHAQFDGLILAHYFGKRPRFWFDTLSMARVCVGHRSRHSLEQLAQYYQLPAKSVPYNLFRGKHWRELSPEVQRMVADGSKHDSDLTWDIFVRMGQTFPREEYQVIDGTIRMFTEPYLEVDIDLLREIWLDENAKRLEFFERIGVTEQQLQSAEKFAELLRSFGVQPEMKDGKHKPIYAFAKGDEFMKGLLEGDEGPEVAELAQARINAKSTLEQARAERIAAMAQRGRSCVYLKYASAHTLRWSGGDGINWQNMKRINPLDEKSGRMRKAQLAPKGMKILVADASQIECRLLNYNAGQWDIVEMFRDKKDVYSYTASGLYGREINKKDHPLERFIGKKLELGCGYGVGWLKFQATLRSGIDGPAVYLTDEDAMKAVNVAYRGTHPQVKRYWNEAGYTVIPALAAGVEMQWGPFVIKDHRVYGPDGTWIDYEGLHEAVDEETDEVEWRVPTRNGGWTKLYGGKLVENVTQYLARIIVKQAWLRIRARVSWPLVNTEHDALWFLVPDEGYDNLYLEHVIEEMRRPPPWLPGIPLDAEGFVSSRYDGK